MIALTTGALREIAVVGAHCDDIAIGMGGTLLALSAAEPGIRVRALVLSGQGTEREAEEQSALAAFCPGSDVDLTIHDVPDGRAPAYWDKVKQLLGDFCASCEPNAVFGPHRGDAHQDHRLLAELLPTEFRNHLILGYEVLKWETDTPTPNVFHPLPIDLIETKARLLHKHYPSQAARDWFDEGAFVGLSRLRGVQCRSAYAEAFVMEKAALNFGS
jgi:LmbE family N-acetylglucosaminyl deacetylase